MWKKFRQAENFEKKGITAFVRTGAVDWV